jgi:diguanylate cyclase (GGDEF)-like protein
MKSAVDPVAFRQSLLQLLEAEPRHEESLLEEFEREKQEGYPLYSSILYILTHLSFTEAEAQRHWKKIRAHRTRLRTKLGRDLGLRVALLDYFVNLNRELKNPKVIEISIYERTARSAITDGLTGLYNHAFFVHALRREVQRSRRQDLKLSVVMLDLDDFKKLNDTRGHLEGDRVLMKAASLVTESLREIDTAARYGGEEFAVILPDTPRQGAFVVADRIRSRIHDYFKRKRGSFPVSVSGGVATFPDDGMDPEALVKRADEGLYRSKAGGKNRIAPVRAERRRHVRRPAAHEVSVRIEGRRPTVGEAMDVSAGGLLVNLPRPVPVGSSVTLQLRPRGAPALALLGQIVRVEPDKKEGGFTTAVRLMTELAPVERIDRQRAVRP